MTTAESIRGGLKPAEGAEARSCLRAVQTRVQTAEAVARQAAQAAHRGRAALGRAGDALAAYCALDVSIAEHKAQALRDGGTGAELPHRLADLRRRQRVAQEGADDARRVAELLEGDERAAKAVLAEAEAELRLVVDRVMQAQAAAVVVRMREREREAAADRMLLCGFLSIRTQADPPVDWGLQVVSMEPVHLHLLDIAATARIPDAGPVWQELRSRLLVDAGAVLSNGG